MKQAAQKELKCQLDELTDAQKQSVLPLVKTANTSEVLDIMFHAVVKC